MAYDLYQGYQQGGFAGMLQTGMGIGASMIVGAAVGGVVGSTGIFGNTLGGTILSGATSGAIGGGITSTMFGGSFGDGALSGGLAGGLSAGAGWVGEHASLQMKADDLNLTGESAGPATDKKLNKKSQDWFDRNEGTDDAINSLKVARKDNLVDPYSYIGKDGELYYKDVGKIGGLTTGPANLKGPSDVRISAGSFNSQRRLFMRLGHELIHVDHFYSGAYKNWYERSGKNHNVASKVSDVYAYYWNYSTAKSFGWKQYEKWAYKKYLKYLR